MQPDHQPQKQIPHGQRLQLDKAAIQQQLRRFQLMPTKKVIIVVGKMGHGKSSFIKMLVDDAIKPTIKVGAGLDSVTDKCVLYKMSNHAKTILDIRIQQQIYIMDTPGFNSVDKTYLIIQQIKSVILIQKCQIISICYLKKANQYRKEQSLNIQFHKLFPVTKQIKDKISCYIFTCVDQVLFRMNDFYSNKQQLAKLYQKQQIKFYSLNNIQWINDPLQQGSQFDQLLKINKSKNIRQNQWAQFKQSLKYRNQSFYSYNSFITNNQSFQQLFKHKIIHSLKQTKQYKMQRIQFNISTLDILYKLLTQADPKLKPLFHKVRLIIFVDILSYIYLMKNKTQSGFNLFFCGLMYANYKLDKKINHIIKKKHFKTVSIM